MIRVKINNFNTIQMRVEFANLIVNVDVDDFSKFAANIFDAGFFHPFRNIPDIYCKQFLCLEIGADGSVALDLTFLFRHDQPDRFRIRVFTNSQRRHFITCKHFRFGLKSQGHLQAQ